MLFVNKNATTQMNHEDIMVYFQRVFWIVQYINYHNKAVNKKSKYRKSKRSKEASQFLDEHIKNMVGPFVALISNTSFAENFIIIFLFLSLHK